MLSVRGLHFSYNRAFSLDIKSLDIPEGSLSVIIGPNGSGKTTFAKIISGLIDDYKGSVEIDSFDIKKLDAKNRSRIISYIHRRMVKDLYIPVKRFVGIGRYVHKESVFLNLNKSDRMIIDEMLDVVDLRQKKGVLLSQLSDGELQRAIIAKILCQQTKYTVLDEPTSALDIAHVASILNLLRRIKSKTTIVVILHDINEAIKIYDNLICLNEGKVECVWEKENVFDLQKLEKLFKIKLNEFNHGSGRVVYF